MRRRLLVALLFAGLCVLALYGLVAQLFRSGENTSSERSWS
jgi:4-amino-4-deoxy-L-arabinose transferase-like glycosyltransferase